MDTGKGSSVAQLVDHFLNLLQKVADSDDLKESDGWVGKWTIVGDKGFSRCYEIRSGRFQPIGEQQEYTGQVEMSIDTFLDLIDAGMHGRGELVFADKYAKHAIRYKGAQWIVDSERFRKVLRRLGK
jgi:hypothetical protein